MTKLEIVLEPEMVAWRAFATPSSLDVFAEGIKRIVEGIGDDFTETDDDWMATLIIETDDGQRLAIGLSGDLFDGEFRKDILVMTMKHTLAGMKAMRYALVLSAWGILGREGGTEEEIRATHQEWRGRFQDHPERIEMVVLQIVDREQEFGMTAEIQRHEDKPPTLGEWKKSTGMSGRFPSLREALHTEEES